jgi:5-(carboxyamino)imidazole ribonucleotide synthase
MNDEIQQPLAPGSTLGVFGGGQLGRMFAEAAQRLGYRVHVYAPDEDSPAGQVADLQTTADYHDFQAVESFAKAVDAITLEFENVPVAAAEAAARFAPVCPSGDVLFTVQDRSREKRFLVGAGIPTTPTAQVRSSDELLAAASQIGTPAVLKTTKFGYDGKGQRVVATPEDAAEAWQYLGRHKCVWEKFVDFRREVSVVVARAADGSMATCGPIENAHAHHILDVSVVPATSSTAAADQAIAIAKQVAHELGVNGIICVEFFETAAGDMLVNEMAPRPHNSGHLTIEACGASQFEQQARTLAGLPLGDFAVQRPAAMANLLGHLWSGGEPHWDRLAEFPEVKLHLYGKRHARPGRKMGHLTALADSPAEAEQLVRAAREAIANEQRCS